MDRLLHTLNRYRLGLTTMGLQFVVGCWVPCVHIALGAALLQVGQHNPAAQMHLSPVECLPLSLIRLCVAFLTVVSPWVAVHVSRA